MPILPKERDPRLITVRRGGTLSDDDHRLLAEWALQCAEHVLPLFEEERPDDGRPRAALEVGRAWIRGELPMKAAHQAAFQANAAGRGMPDPVRFAALSAGQAVAVAHVAAHDLGAAAYAIRAVEASVTPDGDTGGTGDTGGPDADADARSRARSEEREWQRSQLPPAVRDLVLDDQRLRNALCWNVFS